MSHGSHLEFQDVGSRYTFGIAPIEFVDLKKVCLDIKILFVCAL